MTQNTQPQDLYFQLSALLQSDRSDEELNDALLELSKVWWFPAFCYLYGPILYRRNREQFRPLLLSHFDTASLDSDGKAYDPWQGSEAAELQAWLEAADEFDDVRMFALLYAWRCRSLPTQVRAEQWRKDLIARFGAAESTEARAVVLSKLSGLEKLDEPTAFQLYRWEPALTPTFIKQHLPATGGTHSCYWAQLSALIRKQGDHDFFFAVYRRTVENDQWARDVDLLADRFSDEDELIKQLLLRHPDEQRKNVSSVLYGLLRKCGDAVVPYALAVVQRSVFGLGAEPARHNDLIRLADDKNWLQLWASLIWATGRPTEVDREVRRLAFDRRRNETAVTERLCVLARLARPGEKFSDNRAAVSDETAVKLYERFPLHLRRLFRSHLRIGPTGYARLASAVVAAKDEPMSDYLTSLVICVDFQMEWARREVVPMIDVLTPQYEKLLNQPEAFARRAASVLGFIAEGAIPVSAIRSGFRANRLANLFFGRDPSDYLSNPDALRDLLESPNPHVQTLAFQSLETNDERARDIGGSNLDLLGATLLTNLPRKARRRALAAIENVCQLARNAEKMLPALRQATDIPDRIFSRNEIIALVGRLLCRHPELQKQKEQRCEARWSA